MKCGGAHDDGQLGCGDGMERHLNDDILDVDVGGTGITIDILLCGDFSGAGLSDEIIECWGAFQDSFACHLQAILSAIPFEWMHRPIFDGFSFLFVFCQIAGRSL